MTGRRSGRTAAAHLVGTMIIVASLLIMVACSANGQPTPPNPTTAPNPTLAQSQSATGASPTAAATNSAAPTVEPEPSITEPTTTNTLPPPPEATKAEPSTSGDLSGDSLPTPQGWEPTALDGDDHTGYHGNGTWTLARDPRYAAQEAITIGCAQITRDDYPDPIHALEGNYVNSSGLPGVGLVMQFADKGDATDYFAQYRQQVAACVGGGDISAELIDNTATTLADRRTYPDGEWTEVARHHNDRVVMIILSDPGHRISTETAKKLIAAIPV